MINCLSKQTKLPSRRDLSQKLIPAAAAKIRADKKEMMNNESISLCFDEYSNNKRRFL
ncbi:hypothetical protein FO519_010194, partial [Halicephalobus sp. NKZ332]